MRGRRNPSAFGTAAWDAVKAIALRNESAVYIVGALSDEERA